MRRWVIRTLVVGSALIATGAASGAAMATETPTNPPSGSEPPGGSSSTEGGLTCSTSAGPLTMDHVWVRPPGGSWEAGLKKLCASLYYQETAEPDGTRVLNVSFGFSTLEGSNQDLSSVYPTGTLISFDLTSTGAAPLMVDGAMANPAAAFDGQTVEIQGETTSVKFAKFYDAEHNPQCVGGNTDTMASFFGGALMLEPAGTGQAAAMLRAYKGSFFGTNAEMNGLPVLLSNGSVSILVAGCGNDSSPVKEGFFEGFLPTAALTQMGLGAGTANSMPAPALNGLMEITNNGKVEPSARFAPATSGTGPVETPDGPPLAPKTGLAGITIDYRLHYSSHTLVTKVNHRRAKVDAKLVRACRARHGKLRYVAARKHRAAKLVCERSSRSHRRSKPHR